MNKKTHQLMFGLSLLALSASHLQADTGAPAPALKNLEEVIEETNYVETAQNGIVLSGYVDAGYIYNFTGGAMNGRAGHDGSAKGDFNLNQVKLVLEKPLTDKNELQAGFRADIMFGEDAGDIGGNAGGSPDGDSIYLQQAYVDLLLPVGNGLELWIGKWQQPLGWEAEERAANINITAGLASAGDPGGTVGIFGIYPLNDVAELSFGVMNGSGLDDGINALGGDSVSLTGQLVLTPTENLTTYHGFYLAPNGDAGYSANDELLYAFNNMIEWTPSFANERLLLASAFTYVNMDEFAPGTSDSEFYGVALYAKYLLNDIVSIGTRIEYAHTDDSQFVDMSGGLGGINGAATLGSNDNYSWTATLGFDLLENFLLRTEYRVDWGNDSAVHSNGATITGTDDIAHTIAMQAVYSF